MYKSDILFPYIAIIYNDIVDYGALYDWCYDKFGNCQHHNIENYNWTWPAGSARRVFSFKNEEDYILFKFTWC